MADRNDEPKSRLLDGRSGSWKQGSAQGVGADGIALRLAGDSRGSLRLASRDGSLGRLILPRGIAVTADRQLYLLDPDGQEIRYLDPRQPQHPFRLLPEVGGRFERKPERCGLGVVDRDPPRRFRKAQSIAVSHRDLLVADAGNFRVQVFDLQTWALRAIWTFLTKPIDVAVAGVDVFVLTEGGIFRTRPGDDRPRLFFEAADISWTRLAVDREFKLYALRSGDPLVLDAFSEAGALEATSKPIVDPAQVRDRFDAPAIRSVPEESPKVRLRFVAPPELVRPCPDEPSSRTSSPSICEANHGLVFSSNGSITSTSECRYPSTPLYRREGTWISEALDSSIFRCSWHRVEVKLADLPDGCGLKIQTYTSEGMHWPAEIEFLPEEAWTDAVVVSSYAGNPESMGAAEFDGLVRSGVGRYLWLRVVLTGAGFETPVVDSIRVHFPRQSYLEYLPPIFSQDEQSRQFLERFLAIFQTEWDELERRLGDFAAYLDPRAVPGKGGFLEYLAEWMGVDFENHWSPTQRRRWLASMPALTFASRTPDSEDPGRNRRGAREGLRAYLQAYLCNMVDDEAPAATPFPRLVEGFRERDFLIANAEGTEPRPLWSSDFVNRLALDGPARLDEAQLISFGSPDLDLFNHFAHRFRVFVPAGWVRDRQSEGDFRRALEAEKPAHVDYDLHLVPNRFRLGIQSTCGIDTILGDVSPTTLPGTLDTKQWPPSRPPTSRLGYDTILSTLQPEAVPTVDVGLRLEPIGMRL